MSEAELSDVSNGIWMCYTHGKLIDTDENLFTVEMLQTWRAISEARARVWQALGTKSSPSPKDLAGIALPSEQLGLTRTHDESAAIGSAFQSCCVEQLWGVGRARAIRDAAIELVRNSFQHGCATTCEVLIQPKWIDIVDDGAAYDSAALLRDSVSGGAEALRIVREEHGSSVVTTHRRQGEKNITRFAMLRTAADILDASPCSFQLQRLSHQEPASKVPALLDCNTVYFVLPPFMSISDGLRFHLPQEASALEGRKIVLVGEALSEHAIHLLRQRNPNWTVLNLEL